MPAQDRSPLRTPYPRLRSRGQLALRAVTCGCCAGIEVEIAPGDVLVLYTDGITEADNSTGEEFGENRLLETIRAHLALPVSSILGAIVSAALEFSGGEGRMRDDLTLVVARGRWIASWNQYTRQVCLTRSETPTPFWRTRQRCLVPFRGEDMQNHQLAVAHRHDVALAVATELYGLKMWPLN